MFYKKNSKKDNRIFTTGFTLVETLVVISIMMLLTTTLIAYTRSSGKQIALSTEQAKLIGMLNRAKSLALQRDTAEQFCAYGIRFNPPSTYEIVRTRNLQVKGKAYTPCDTTQIESYGEAQTIKDPVVIANAPQPIVFKGPYIQVTGAGEVVLQVSGSSPILEAKVVVSSVGGISTK